MDSEWEGKAGTQGRGDSISKGTRQEHRECTRWRCQQGCDTKGVTEA